MPVAAPAPSGLVRTIPKLVNTGQIQPPPNARNVAAMWTPGARRASSAMPAEPASPVRPASRNGAIRIVSERQPLISLSVTPVAAPRPRNRPAGPGPIPASTAEPTVQAFRAPAVKARNTPTIAATTRALNDDSVVEAARALGAAGECNDTLRIAMRAPRARMAPIT